VKIVINNEFASSFVHVKIDVGLKYHSVDLIFQDFATSFICHLVLKLPWHLNQHLITINHVLKQNVLAKARRKHVAFSFDENQI
jgi:hypothetical protein